jgi:peptide/nickel transport system permease protein
MPEPSPELTGDPPGAPGAPGATGAIAPGTTGEPVSTAIAAADLIADELALELAGAVAPVEEAYEKKLGLGAWLAIGWMIFVIVLAISAPFLSHLGLKDPNAQDASCLHVGVPNGPSGTHWLGCDGIGRDLLARNIWGARASLMIATGSIVFGFVIGGFFGLAAGYYRGKRDTFLTGMFDVMLAFPQIVLAILLVTVMATGDNVTSTRRIVVVILAIGIVSVPILGRITRANTLTWSQREFVLAARAQGARNQRIMWREVLPHVLPAMFSISLLGVAVAIVAEGGLSIFGLGTQLPTPSWGNIIAGGVKNLESAPHIVFGASTFIFLTVLALNFLGDVIREHFDVRESLL